MPSTRASWLGCAAIAALACSGSTSAPPAPPPVEPTVDAPEPVEPSVAADPARSPSALDGQGISATVQVDGGEPRPFKVLVGDDLAPGTHPPPFSTDELRAGIPLGSVFRYRITRPDHPPVLSTWEVVEHGPKEFTFRYTDTREDGTLYAPPRDKPTYWVELRNRSAFPEAEYTKAKTTVQFRGEAVPGWVYEMRAASGGYVERSWFAKPNPGPPVLFTAEDKGVVQMRMELLERMP